MSTSETEKYVKRAVKTSNEKFGPLSTEDRLKAVNLSVDLLVGLLLGKGLISKEEFMHGAMVAYAEALKLVNKEKGTSDASD